MHSLETIASLERQAQRDLSIERSLSTGEAIDTLDDFIRDEADDCIADMLIAHLEIVELARQGLKKL